MAVTRLKRKERVNRKVARARKANMKLLTKTPVIRKVDIEELKKVSHPSLVKKVEKAVGHAAEEVVEKVKEVAKKVTE